MAIARQIRPMGTCWPSIALRRLALLICLGAPALFASSASAERNPYDWALVGLDYMRHEKVDQLRRFCERIHNLAAKAQQDPSIIECFDINRQYVEMAKKSAPPEALKKKVEELNTAFEDYYIENFIAFYDILFVDKQGRVFHTIRNESDQNKNLLDNCELSTPLAACFRSDPQEEVFIDIHNYAPSGEPAAFFVEPVKKNGEGIGWLVLQCAINKVNSLFAWNDEIGRTGETFLVNHKGLMLTESNFEGDSTILKKRLDDRNIQAKFQDKQGHRTVTDYRGQTALTSFEVFEFMGTRWLVVAKMDKAEVTTDHFVRHRKYYSDRILHDLTASPVAASRTAYPFGGKRIRRIDMDEFLKADRDELLQTFGVSTCTGLIASYPGRFGYMAHISPEDQVYGSGGTNLLGQLVKKIQTFDIHEYARRDVKFVIVARHLDSTIQIIDKLVDEGFLLSQISVLYNPQSRYATITYDYSKDAIGVSWEMAEGTEDKCIHHGQDARNVGELVSEAIFSEDALKSEMQTP